MEANQTQGMSMSPTIKNQSLPSDNSNDLLNKFPLPLTPRVVLQHFSDKLTSLEIGEILDFQRIYYFGMGAVKVKGDPWGESNFGYDDSRGDLKLVRHDHLGFRFEIIDKLGKGSFGQVIKGFDHKTKQFVAIKIIRNKKRFQKQSLIELKVLERIKDADGWNVVKFLESFNFRNHLCFVFELLSINLYEQIKMDNFSGYQPKVVQIYAKQLLNCLMLLKRENIIHCDLKPENILLDLNAKNIIKVIDFGSSCFVNERIHTYIQSRFYRSPEVVLGLPYNTSIDMWSLGCILVELYSGNPLFPGSNESDLLLRMIEVLGGPPVKMVKSSLGKQMFFDENGNPKLTLDSKGETRIPGSKPIHTILESCKDSEFIDFVSKCLSWSTESRMTPDEATRHPWINKRYQEESESSRARSGSSSDDDTISDPGLQKIIGRELLISPNSSSSHDSHFID